MHVLSYFFMSSVRKQKPLPGKLSRGWCILDLIGQVGVVRENRSLIDYQKCVLHLILAVDGRKSLKGGYPVYSTH